MQVIGSTRKMDKTCSKETWPFPRCWWSMWSKLDAEIAPRSSCVFRPLLPSLKSCRRTQVESASWRGPEDHAGRVQVQAVPPQQSAPIEDQRGSYFVHTNQLPTLLFGTDTLLLLQPAKGSLRDSRGWWGAIPDIFRCSIYCFCSEWSDTGIISRVVQQWSNYLQVHNDT